MRHPGYLAARLFLIPHFSRCGTHFDVYALRLVRNASARLKLIAVLLGGLSLAAGGRLVSQPLPVTHVDDFAGHPRVVVISDIGNEPDDQMSFTRLLLYSNELDLEALIAATSTWQKTVTHPETMYKLIEAYGQVRGNLLLHAQGWPAREDLDGRVFAGQPTYGMAATGLDKMSDGAKAILSAADRDDPRPLWVSIWGGANTLAEALLYARANRPPDEMKKLVAKLRVYSISDQDDAGPWIRREFPDLFYIVQPSTPTSGEYYYATWTGISGDRYYRNGGGADFTTVTNEWLDANIRSKGPMGKLYPKFMFIMEGDTPSFLNLIDNGLAAWQRPDWGGWGGRYIYRQPYGETHPIWTQGGDEFGRVTSQDTVTGMDGHEYVSDQATICAGARLSRIFCRAHGLDGCRLCACESQSGGCGEWTGRDRSDCDRRGGWEGGRARASGTRDPDGQALHYRWFHYTEAGCGGWESFDVSLTGADSANAVVTATAVCRAVAADWASCSGDGVAHIILAVTDDGSPRLTSYRRVILRCMRRGLVEPPTSLQDVGIRHPASRFAKIWRLICLLR